MTQTNHDERGAPPAGEARLRRPSAMKESLVGVRDSVVIVEDLVKSYRGKTVLDHVSLHVDRGETVVIVGGSGAGKSTLIRQIVGLERPDSGRIVIAGVDVLRLGEVDLLKEHRRIALVFQKDALLDSMSVFDNVAFPLREELGLRGPDVRRRVMAKLEALALADARDKLPGELSGGMAKRVGIARALVVEPEILIYDEPTSGLDPVTARKVDRLMDEMRNRFFVTSLVITHDMASAYEIADRVMLLDSGRFVAEGPPELFFGSDNPIVRTFADASAIEPEKLVAARASRRTPAEIANAWRAAHPGGVA
jgi:phospholipid/cholesterol/gamma-HCH transport system ATP-binding protein